MSNNKNVRIYVDGIFDLFHRAHVEVLRKAKEYRENVTLIVGVISDKDATGYKRAPIFNEDDRYTIVRSVRYVDEVIFNAPLILTKEFVDLHKIDLILHSFSDTTDFEKQKEFTREVDNIFQIVPYFPHVSTTGLIAKIRGGVSPPRDN